MKIYILLTALLLTPTFIFARFEDFSEFPSWGETAIEATKEAGIMTGYADGTFRPDAVMNRAEALMTLFRLKGRDTSGTEYVRNFSDVPRGEWFADAVNMAVAEGWIQGYEDGTFRPGNTINNAEWATLLQRAFDLEPNPENMPSFADVPSRVWFGDSVAAIYANGLVRSESAKFFYPGLGLTRAGAAWTIAVILQMPRLMGTSQENDFTGAYIDSRRTAYPRGSDFNPNLQGYDIERSALKIETNANEEAFPLTRTDDWTSIGQLRLTNTLDELVELSSLEFKLRFESTSVGPDRSFMLRIVGSEIDKELSLDRTGAVLFGGLKKYIPSGDTFVLHIKVKPDVSQYFYAKSGPGVISIENVIGSTIGKITSGDDAGRTIVRSAPIEFIDRIFTPFVFQP